MHCPVQSGSCVTSTGADQNTGVTQINDVDGDTAASQAACLAACKLVGGATGCEIVWDLASRGCYVHTEAIARGNNADNHACWVFSSCDVAPTAATIAPANKRLLSVTPSPPEPAISGLEADYMGYTYETRYNQNCVSDKPSVGKLSVSACKAVCTASATCKGVKHQGAGGTVDVASCYTLSQEPINCPSGMNVLDEDIRARHIRARQVTYVMWDVYAKVPHYSLHSIYMPSHICCMCFSGPFYKKLSCMGNNHWHELLRCSWFRPITCGWNRN